MEPFTAAAFLSPTAGEAQTDHLWRLMVNVPKALKVHMKKDKFILVIKDT